MKKGFWVDWIVFGGSVFVVKLQKLYSPEYRFTWRNNDNRQKGNTRCRTF